MKNLYYYAGTIGIFYLEGLIACLISSIDDVFPPLAAIAVSCLGFLFPSLFYLTAESLFLKDRKNLIKQFEKDEVGLEEDEKVKDVTRNKKYRTYLHRCA